MFTVSATIHQIVPILWHHFRSLISWPSLRQWRHHQNSCRYFPNTVGAIDRTYTPIKRPSDSRENFYSRDIDTDM
jgi:hypothetical protein